MTIKALHIPYGTSPVTEVQVNERNATSYYAYVNGGPVEGGYLTVGGVDVVCYVNSKYPQLDGDLINPRASQLFELAGVGMAGGAILGDALLVLAGDEYEKCTPSDIVTHLINSGATRLSERERTQQDRPSDRRKIYLAEYLQTRTAAMLAEWDGGTAGSDSADIDVYCVLGWADVTRALAAAQMIEREMRRGARAHRDVFGLSSPDKRDVDPDSFLMRLADAPPPLHTNQSGLEIVEVTGPPLALRLSPTSDTAGALTHAIASLVGYTMAGFGRPFGTRWFTGRNLRPSDQELRSVVGFIGTGRPAFDVTSLREHMAEDLDSTFFQFVSSPPPTEYMGYEVHLVVQRVSDGLVDLVHAWY